jgi:hypothetical protein
VIPPAVILCLVRTIAGAVIAKSRLPDALTCAGQGGEGHCRPGRKLIPK